MLLFLSFSLPRSLFRFKSPNWDLLQLLTPHLHPEPYAGQTQEGRRKKETGAIDDSAALWKTKHALSINLTSLSPFLMIVLGVAPRSDDARSNEILSIICLLQWEQTKKGSDGAANVAIIKEKEKSSLGCFLFSLFCSSIQTFWHYPSTSSTFWDYDTHGIVHEDQDEERLNKSDGSHVLSEAVTKGGRKENEGGKKRSRRSFKISTQNDENAIKEREGTTTTQHASLSLREREKERNEREKESFLEVFWKQMTKTHRWTDKNWKLSFQLWQP